MIDFQKLCFNVSDKIVYVAKTHMNNLKAYKIAGRLIKTNTRYNETHVYTEAQYAVDATTTPPGFLAIARHPLVGEVPG